MNKKIICYDKDNNKFEIDSTQVTFRPSVYGVLIEDNKILLSKQWDGYEFPGGGMEIYETMEQTVIREFFEETGLKVEPIKLLHAESSFFCPTHDKKFADCYWNCPLLYFLVKKVGGKISIENFDESEKHYADMPEWIELDKIPKTKFVTSADFRSIINNAKQALS